MTYYLVQGDTGSQIQATLTRHDTGEAVPLENATTVLKFKLKGANSILFTITGLGTTEALSNGIVVFPLGPNLTIDPGYYEGEIEVTYQDTLIESVYELINFQVREEF